MHTFRHVVVGTDFSAGAERAFELAREIAFITTSRLTLVHVCELELGDDEDQRYLQCAERLARLVTRGQRPGVDVTGVLRIGRPWQKLDNVATEVGAFLIVVGRHGAGRGLSVEVGQVAAQLVRSASRPVLIVAPDSDASETRRAKTTHPSERADEP